MSGPYLLATQRAWGETVFRRSVVDPEPWVLRQADTDDPDFGISLADLVAQVRPRYAFFVHWSTLVPKAVLDACECVNFHCTPLPYGRGGHPIENLLLAGRTETVITAHRMVRELDAGPIYSRSGPVSLAGTKPEILDRFIQPVAELIRWIVEREPRPVPQVGEVVRFSRLSPDVYRQVWDAHGGEGTW